MGDCRNLGLIFDVGRLMRLLICRNNTTAIKERFFWCEGEQWTPESRDIMGRTGLFYALWPYPDNDMLEYIASRRYSPNSIPPDDKNKNLLRYAIKLNSLHAVALLLDLDYDASEVLSPVQIQSPYPVNGDWNIALCITYLVRSHELLRGIFSRNVTLDGPERIKDAQDLIQKCGMPYKTYRLGSASDHTGFVEMHYEWMNV